MHFDFNHILHDPSFWVACAFLLVVICFFKQGKEYLFNILDSHIQDIDSEIVKSAKLYDQAQKNYELYVDKLNKVKSEQSTYIHQAKVQVIANNNFLTQEIDNLNKLNEQNIANKIQYIRNNDIMYINNIVVQKAVQVMIKLLQDNKHIKSDQHIYDLFAESSSLIKKELLASTN